MKKILSTRGMSIVSVMVGVGIAGIAAYILGDLMLSTSKINRTSRMNNSIAEIRNQFSTVAKDPAFWLNKLRQAPSTKDIFTSCLVSTANPTYKCPPVDAKIFELDPELKKIAGAFHPATIPLIDINGQKIAGSTKEPYYMDAETRACESAPDQCPLQSTGYFFRESTTETDSPGIVSFVIKIEKNPNFNLVTEMAMKPTYISFFVGKSWQSNKNASSDEKPKNCLPDGAATYDADACCGKKSQCMWGLYSGQGLNSGFYERAKSGCVQRIGQHASWAEVPSMCISTCPSISETHRWLLGNRRGLYGCN